MAISTDREGVEIEGNGAVGTGQQPAVALPEHFLIEGPPPASAPARLVATDSRTGARVFIKCDRSASAIRREAAALAAVAGDGVARLVDWHDGPDGGWLAMEYVAGPNFAAFLAGSGGALGAATVVGLLKRLTDTVSHIHGKGFLHRDLKPANIVVDGDAAPVLVDFGAARAKNAEPGPRDPGLVSEGYAAPEQYLTDKPEGAWTDVYGLGALAYRALTGRAPPPSLERLGDETGSIMADLPGDCPVALGRSVDWALRPDPAERPQSVAAWSQALGGAPPPKSPKARLVATFDPQVDDLPPTIPVRRIPLATMMPAPPPPPPRAAPARRGRSRAPLIAALLLCVVLAGLVAAGAWYGWPIYEKYYKQAWTVDASGTADAATIADALSRAGPGAVITIAPGTYTESLVVDYPVRLRPAVADDPPLIAPAQGPCLVSAASGAVVSNLRLGVPAADTPPSSPVACVVAAGGAFTLENSRVSSEQGPAVVIRDGANPTLEGNTIEGGGGAGIVVASGSTGTLAGNTLKDIAEQGLIVRGGARPTITDNTIEASGGVVFTEGAAGTFRGNRILSARANAIEVTTGADPLVADNMIRDAAEAGIFVYDRGAGRFEGNAVVGNKLSGIVVAGGGGPALVGNSIRENAEHGILVLDRSEPTLERNAVEKNKGHALVIGPEAAVERKDDVFEGNKEPQVLDTRPPK